MRNYFLGPPPKPSGDSRGFGGESRSSGMSELSPQAEARDMELATTKGAASRTRRGPPMEKPRAKTWTVRRKKYGSGRNKLWKMLDFFPLMWYSTSVT